MESEVLRVGNARTAIGVDEATERHMIIDPNDVSIGAVYESMVALITPRPIAWVSTLSADGVANLAPYSFFGGVGADGCHESELQADSDQDGVNDTTETDVGTNPLDENEALMPIINIPAMIRGKNE